MIYLIGCIFISLITCIDLLLNSKSFSRLSSLFILFLLLLLVSLRNDVGTDWDAYSSFYKETTDRTEFGYAFVNNLFSNLGFPYYLFLFIINGFSLLLIYLFLRRNSAFLTIGLLIYFSDLFLYYNLSGIRQGIAISITCFSINYAIKRNFILFLIFIILASSFHSSALVFIIVYFIPHHRLKISSFLIYFVLLFVCSIYYTSISEIITLYNLSNSEYYINKHEKAENIWNLFYIGIAKRSLIVILLISFFRFFIKSKNAYYFFNIYIFGFVIYLSTYILSPDIGTRLSSYFTIFEIIISGNLIYSLNDFKYKFFITFLFFIVAFYKILGYMTYETYIYKTIF